MESVERCRPSSLSFSVSGACCFISEPLGTANGLACDSDSVFLSSSPVDSWCHNFLERGLLLKLLNKSLSNPISHPTTTPLLVLNSLNAKLGGSATPGAGQHREGAWGPAPWLYWMQDCPGTSGSSSRVKPTLVGLERGGN